MREAIVAVVLVGVALTPAAAADGHTEHTEKDYLLGVNSNIGSKSCQEWRGSLCFDVDDNAESMVISIDDDLGQTMSGYYTFYDDAGETLGRRNQVACGHGYQTPVPDGADEMILDISGNAAGCEDAAQASPSGTVAVTVFCDPGCEDDPFGF